MRPSPPHTLLLASLFAAALVGCRTTTHRIEFSPSLAEVLVPPDDGAPLARVLVSVRGAERAGGDPGGIFEMHVRMRIENLGDDPVALDTSQLQLVDADLGAFGDPRWQPVPGSAGTEDVPPGSALVLDLIFPFPGGREPHAVNLEGLNLRWALRAGDRSVPLGATFTRVPWPRYRYGAYPYDPYYGFYYGHRFGHWHGGLSHGC